MQFCAVVSLCRDYSQMGGLYSCFKLLQLQSLSSKQFITLYQAISQQKVSRHEWQQPLMLNSLSSFPGCHIFSNSILLTGYWPYRTVAAYCSQLSQPVWDLVWIWQGMAVPRGAAYQSDCLVQILDKGTSKVLFRNCIHRMGSGGLGKETQLLVHAQAFAQRRINSRYW